MLVDNAGCCSKSDRNSEKSSELKNGHSSTSSIKVFVPQVDIVESDDRILLVADLPGVDEHGLDISLQKNVLTLKGTVQASAPAGFELVHSEYEVGNFERSFTVSNDINRDGIEAVIKDGVLRLTLPKAKHATVQKIPVKAM